MKAMIINEYGGADKLQLVEIPKPKPKEGEILVKVFAAGVNPIDWKVREGYYAEIIQNTLPLTLGWDFSGEIEALGDNVDAWHVGDAVYARPEFSKNGAYADYIVVSADEIAAKPKSLNWEQSAVVSLVTLTAWQALKDIANIKQGDRVMIQAGSGGVGIAAIQLAKQAGAIVYTTSTSNNTEFLKGLGADEVIDYTQEDFSTLKDLDIVFDTIGGEVLEKSWATLKRGGSLVSITETPDEALAEKYGIHASFCFGQANSEQLFEIAELIDTGKLKVEIDSVFPLEDIVKAHERSQSGHARGKIVLQIQED